MLLNVYYGEEIPNQSYTNYSGYPGGLRKKTLAEIATGKRLLTVLEGRSTGMIHNNKLKMILKNLIIKE